MGQMRVGQSNGSLLVARLWNDHFQNLDGREFWLPGSAFDDTEIDTCLSTRVGLYLKWNVEARYYCYSYCN